MSEATWTISDNGVLNGYSGKDIDVCVPSGIKKICKNAFFGNSQIETLSLPDSVAEIEPYAFSKCKNLKRLAFGSGIREIPAHLCELDEQLTEIALPSDTYRIGCRAFWACSLKEVILPESTRILESGCFGRNPIRKIRLPEGIRIIESMAFDDSICREIIIPSSVQLLGDRFCGMEYLQTMVVMSSEVHPGNGRDEWGPESFAEWDSFMSRRKPKMTIFCYPQFMRKLPAFARTQCRPLMYWDENAHSCGNKPMTEAGALLELKRQYLWRNEHGDIWASIWKERLRNNPYYNESAKKLVWAICERNIGLPESSIIQTFMLHSDGTAADIQGNSIELFDELKIRLVHPAELDITERNAWRNYLRDHSISQPFVQMFETLYDPYQLDPDFGEKTRFDFFKGPSPVIVSRFRGIRIHALSLIKLENEHFRLEWDDSRFPRKFALAGEHKFSFLFLSAAKPEPSGEWPLYYEPEKTVFILEDMEILESDHIKKTRFCPYVNRMIFLLDCLCAEAAVMDNDYETLQQRKSFLSIGNIDELIQCAKTYAANDVTEYLISARNEILSHEETNK